MQDKAYGFKDTLYNTTDDKVSNTHFQYYSEMNIDLFLNIFFLNLSKTSILNNFKQCYNLFLFLKIVR